MFLHRKGVVHSDLKPDNVLLDEDIRTMKLRCLITDFGICRIISDDIIVVDGFVPLTVNALSLSYASPERIVYGKNGSKAISPKIYPTWDIYSLGIIMFELLNNKKSIY
jgi:serine/threonine protein kinase